MKTLEHRLSTNKNQDIGWLPELISGDFSEDALNKLSVVEYRFGDLCDNDEKYDAAIKARQKLMKILLDRILFLEFVYWNLMPEISSKIRTHKSIFPFEGEIQSGTYSQWEIMADKSNSTLVGSVSVNDSNLSECCKLASDRRRGLFLASSDKRELVDESIASVIFIKRKPTFPNLSVLLDSLGGKWNAFILFGGDQGVTFINVSIFSDKDFSAKIRECPISC